MVVHFHGVVQGRRRRPFFTGGQHFVLHAAVGNGHAVTFSIVRQEFFAGFQVLAGFFLNLLLLSSHHATLKITNQLIQIFITQAGFALLVEAITQACNHGIQVQVFQAAHLFGTAETQSVGRFLVVRFHFCVFLTTRCQQDSSCQHDSQFLHSASNWLTVIVSVVSLQAPYHRASLPR